MFRMYKTLMILAAALVGLWLGRVVLTASSDYSFIPFNITLAAVPLLLVPLFVWTNHHLHGLAQKATYGLLGVLWVLFLPNAFYLLTDFMHLNSVALVNAPDEGSRQMVAYTRGDWLYMYDSLILFGATVFGALSGGLALTLAYTWLRNYLSRTYSAGLMALLMILAAIGVYIGRFGRWNSWEGLTHPYLITSDILSDALGTTTHKRFVLVMLTFILFEVASFAYVWSHKQK